MPIKFRCVHCGQYLGISRSKAGTVVDCPACGRSVGVPKKDGEKAERVGRPSLNHQDSQLAEALREVAAIAQSSDMAIPQLPPVFDRPTDARETREVNAPPPRIIPAEPLPPVRHLDPPPPPKLSPAALEDPNADYSEEETAFDTRLPLEQLALLAEPPEPAPPPRASYGQFQWTNEVPWKLWLAFVAVGFTAIVTGFVLGRWDLNMESGNAGTQDVSQEPTPEQNAASAQDVYAHLGALAAEGTIKYSEGEGRPITPDAGAWIYAFPLKNETGKMLKPEWFESNHPARIQALQILGGNAVQADANGQFQLDLLREGKYLLIVSSAHKSRPTSAANSKTPPDVLKQYFEDPEAFLGQWAFQSQEVEYQGEPITVNFDFL
jgi:hypothetical protein